MSITYYDQHANRYFQDTVGADLDQIRARFLAHVPAGGRILDAGCGSGRDALAFLEAGYAVTAFDGSAAMASLASEHTGLSVRQLTFDRVEWRSEFDGVWACASLLHVDRDALPDTISGLAAGLVMSGVMFTCFKFGEQDREVDGRRFTDLDEDKIKVVLRQSGLTVLELWRSQDVKTNPSAEVWINAISQPVAAVAARP